MNSPTISLNSLDTVSLKSSYTPTSDSDISPGISPNNENLENNDDNDNNVENNNNENKNNYLIE